MRNSPASGSQARRSGVFAVKAFVLGIILLLMARPVFGIPLFLVAQGAVIFFTVVTFGLIVTLFVLGNKIHYIDRFPEPSTHAERQSAMEALNLEPWIPVDNQVVEAEIVPDEPD